MSRGISGNSPLLSSCLFSQQADFNGIGYIRKAVSLQYYSILNLILRGKGGDRGVYLCECVQCFPPLYYFKMQLLKGQLMHILLCFLGQQNQSMLSTKLLR